MPGRSPKSPIVGGVRTDQATLLAYATDASVYRVEPHAVVVAARVDDIPATLDWARGEGLALTMRGAGTSLAGQAVGAGVVLDCSRLDRILEIDPQRRRARVEPGVVQADLDAAAAAHGLTFGPDTATAARATIGGMIGNDAAGMRSIVYGRTSHRVQRLRVLLADGSVHDVNSGTTAGLNGAFATAVDIAERHRSSVAERWPRLLRCVDGYNLPALADDAPDPVRFLCGSEGTLALVLEAEVELDPRPARRAWTIVRLASFDVVGEATIALLETDPSAVELVDTGAVVGNPAAREIGEGADAVLLVEHSGSDADISDRRARIRDVPGAVSTLRVDAPGQIQRLIEFRRGMLGTVTRAVSGPRVATTVMEDGAVPVERLGSFLHDIRALFRAEDTGSVLYGHASVGCIHARPLLDLADAEDRRRFRRIAEAGADIVIRHGGALSGEHGDGILRAELLPRLFGSELMGAFAAIKQAFDPDCLLNPGRILDAPPLDENLRFGSVERRPDRLERAAAGCVGIGSCVERRAGTMCPPYRVTRNELHTTRGRADLLREVMAGRLSADDAGFVESMSTCIGCKACKSECPAGVDLAWLKTDFLARRYESRRVPGRERAIAQLPTHLARLSRASRVANAVMASPIGGLARRRLGFHPQREMPRVAPRSFRQLVDGRYGVRRVDVALFVDTFTNYLEPAIGLAALDYLDAAGASPAVAPNVCCGRTYLSAGLVEEARRLAAENVRRLLPLANAGVPIVGLEPSCILTLRDELLRLLPHDEEARAVARQAYLWEDALDRWETPALTPVTAPLVVHPHCHARAASDAAAPGAAVARIPGARVETLDAGCCGMAGAFGYRRERYALSVAIAQDRLVPSVRAHPDAVIVAHGTSCRTQLLDLAGVRAVHPAELLAGQLVVDAGAAS